MQMAHLLRGRQGAKVLGLDGVGLSWDIAELVVVGMGKQSILAVMIAGLCGVRR